jgi:hypothetical protein
MVADVEQFSEKRNKLRKGILNNVKVISPLQ